jgi:hypothetical protein
LPELLDDRCVTLVQPDDIEALSAGLLAARRLPELHAAARRPQDQMIGQDEDRYREVE